MRRIAALMAVIPVMTAAQQIGQNASPQDNLTATFTAGIQLVVEHVSVIDKKGRPVSGLTAKDFAITENGVPQTIRFFEEQKLPDAPLKPVTPAKPEHIHVYANERRRHGCNHALPRWRCKCAAGFYR